MTLYAVALEVDFSKLGYEGNRNRKRVRYFIRALDNIRKGRMKITCHQTSNDRGTYNKHLKINGRTSTQRE